MKSYTFFLFLFLSVNLNVFANQDSISIGAISELDIPEEILSRIPNDELARFITGRDRVVKTLTPIVKATDVYQQIGVSKEVFARIPNDELFDFLAAKGFIELETAAPINNSTNYGPPPTKHVIAILFTIIGIITILYALSMFLAHQRKNKDQEIVLVAIESGNEIPYDFLLSKRRNLNLGKGILFGMTGLGILLAGFFDVLPSSLSLIPISIGIGFFMMAYFIKD